MESVDKGLTSFYNAFHDSENHEEAIEELRDLQEQVNDAVRRKYQWEGLDLQQGFHSVGYLPAGSNARFTISESARLEVLRRLSRLNTTSLGTQATSGSVKVITRSSGDHSPKSGSGQDDLFESERP